MLDGLGVNYNTAMSMDALHGAYPGTFFFCSETCSEESSRGVYQDPQLLNTGENYTPGKRATSSYDNNLASWTMSGEYELKKDRDREFWQGGFLWSGQDYIGEPTPYDVFPVKASFFGAIDTAGFPKDAYYLFKSQWTTAPMVHIVPMTWTGFQPGQPVSVWVYANVATVELFLNGQSLGAKSFDQKVTTFGRRYLETTEPTGDDYNYPSGSYTSPNGSTGKLHLTWTVPFQPGRRRGRHPERPDRGHRLGRHRRAAAGAHAHAQHPGDPRGRDLAGLHRRRDHQPEGVPVPGAANPIQFSVTGPAMLAGVDNGRQENPQSYQASSVPAFNGRALVIVGSAPQGGRAAARHGDRITVTASSPGLRGAQVTLGSVAASGRRAVTARAAAPALAAPRSGGPAHAGSGQPPAADASYSGAPATVPAAMLDGDLSTGWSNYYDKAQTANLRAVSVLQPGRLGHAVVAAAAVHRLGRRLLHHRRAARAARHDRRVVLGRPGVRARAEPGHRLGHRVQSADHAHLRPGPQQPAPAGHDQRGAGHRRRLPDDRRASGTQRGVKIG